MAVPLLLLDIYPGEFASPNRIGKENVLEDLQSYFYMDSLDATKILFLYVMLNVLSIQSYKTLKYYDKTFLKSKRLAESVWRCVYHSFTWVYCAYEIWSRKENVFWKPHLAWEGWGDTEVLTNFLQLFYLLQMSFHIYSITYILKDEKKENNAFSILAFHMLLLILFGLFYTLHYFQLGLLLSFVYDAPCFVLEMTRISVYSVKYSSNFGQFSVPGFSIYTLLWTIITLYLFPVKILYLGVLSTLTHVDRPLVEMITFVMLLLQLFNLYWLVLVLNWIKTKAERNREFDFVTIYTFFHKRSTPKREMISQSSGSETSGEKKKFDASTLMQTVKCVIKLKRKIKRMRRDKQKKKNEDDTFEIHLSPSDRLTIDVIHDENESRELLTDSTTSKERRENEKNKESIRARQSTSSDRIKSDFLNEDSIRDGTFISSDIMEH